MKEEKSMDELFEELIQELDFLPPNPKVREGFLKAYQFFMLA